MEAVAAGDADAPVVGGFDVSDLLLDPAEGAAPLVGGSPDFVSFRLPGWDGVAPGEGKLPGGAVTGC